MARGHDRRQPRLAPPFLVDLSPERQTRSITIEAAAKEYYEQLARVAPYYDVQEQMPKGTELPELPLVPDALIWLERFEEWGFPHAGSWMDQPKWFMEDMRAAKRGRDTWKYEQDRTRLQALQQAQAMPQAPNTNGANIKNLLDAAERLTMG